MKIKITVILIIFAAVLSGCVIDMEKSGISISDDLISYHEEIELDENLKEANAYFEADASNVKISSSHNKLVEGVFRYNSEDLKPKFEVEGGDIRIQSSNPPIKIRRIISEWDISLTEKLPVSMNIEANASKAEMDLNDIKLKQIAMKLGAATINVYSDKPNVEILGDMSIDADASSLNLYGGGNMNFERIKVDSDASRLNLDLSGEYFRNADINITANASTLKLRLPENAGTRIIVENSEVSTIRLNNENISKVSEKEYVSANYDSSEIKIIITLKLNVTTVTIE
ncbi:MAG: hypothetical protein ACOZCL_16590 [Bacillota bacterium]